jgi:C-terminal processing protease CtpA/Prc
VSGDKLGYIKVATFNSNTTEGVERALADMKKEGVAALLLDIRNNGGGLFPAGGWACSEMNKWCQ